MSQFETFTIVPASMSAREIMCLAHETKRLAITNGRSIILAPRLLKGYRRINFFRVANT